MYLIDLTNVSGSVVLLKRGGFFGSDWFLICLVTASPNLIKEKIVHGDFKVFKSATESQPHHISNR